MSAILLHLLAAALYAGLSITIWRSRARGPLLSQPPHGLRLWERSLLLLALFAHGFTVLKGFFGGNMHFGFSEALSFMLWLAILIYWFESLSARMEGVQMLCLPLASVCVLLPLVLPSQRLLLYVDSTAFRIHFLLAMLANSLVTIAALHALLMAAAERQLHRGQLSPVLAGLPPLLSMEAVLFRLIHIAFILLSLMLVSGILFSEHLFGKAFPISHKTVFAMFSWAIFAALLIGRHLRGWRGRTALRWTLAGFFTLLLAYVGSSFVLEVILGRTA